MSDYERLADVGKLESALQYALEVLTPEIADEHDKALCNSIVKELDYLGKLPTIDFDSLLIWHNAVLNPPRIPRDEKRVGPLLVTDGKRKPYEAYYASLLYRDVHVCRWVKSDYPGMMPYPLGKDEVLYWMKWPEPPEKEENNGAKI